MGPGKEHRTCKVGVLGSAEPAKGLSLLNSHGVSSCPRPQPRHCRVKFLSPGNHKLLLFRKKPGGGGVNSPQLPLSGGGGWGLSYPQLPLSVCDLDQVTSCLQALLPALEEN